MTKHTTQQKKTCLKCEKEKRTVEFYMSNSTNHSDKKYPVCKSCIKENLKLENPLSQEAVESIKNVLLEMNRPFIYSLYISTVEEAKKNSKEIFGLYLKNIQLNFKECTWKDSEFVINNVDNNHEVKNNVSVISSNTNHKEAIDELVVINSRDREDVIRMLGYDPFIHENPKDRNQLYNRLIDFLDESTLEDGFKLQAVIEIVIGFNQIDKINQAITNITNDLDNLSTNSGGIKSLIDSKKNILASLIKLAEENGISVKHNNQKSKGAGTLTGIIKALQEKGIDEGELNLFDIETSRGMKQVADISNKSIIQQLQFDENDYTNMILEQRDLITELDEKVIKLEEENRLLKKELLKYRQSEGDLDV